MANINVTYQDLEDAAGRLQNGQSELTNKLDELKAFIDSLVSGGFVTEQASVAFQEKYGEFTSGATQVVGSLEGLSSFLRQTANVMRDTDTGLAQAIRGQ
ncbi:WXG100 family type VII secretion target [Actinotalea fermentans]|uniref:ESAT-6-like protein n=1 Tax=Actinotalea fermentans TaxID=43671 RepID=A0A511YZ48_9CELL|nr:WXG100 family type VII secretion target [Actinotalea fermentans]KGM15729.1 type VII secretion protein [Actinotalea fermentans ATCC 43279 = JCM 9966 = DSM 3133]GEN80487.1 hypothetical protein AFE02nite_22210 [Actinotalea fermentans]